EWVGPDGLVKSDKPVKITDIKYFGKKAWAFVEGSTTGLPMEEIKVIKKKEETQHPVANVKKEALSETQTGKKSEEKLKTAYELAEEKLNKAEAEAKSKK